MSASVTVSCSRVWSDTWAPTARIGTRTCGIGHAASGPGLRRPRPRGPGPGRDRDRLDSNPKPEPAANTMSLCSRCFASIRDHAEMDRMTDRYMYMHACIHTCIVTYTAIHFVVMFRYITLRFVPWLPACLPAYRPACVHIICTHAYICTYVLRPGHACMHAQCRHDVLCGFGR